jgi:hypothetical protein
MSLQSWGKIKHYASILRISQSPIAERKKKSIAQIDQEVAPTADKI